MLPNFNIDQATALANSLFKLKGSLIALNGERDLNFLVDSNHGKFVLKIANENESLAILDCQHQVFQQLSDKSIFDQQTLPLESINGKTIETISDSAGNSHYCRVLPYIEGQLFSSVNPAFPGLLSNLGKTLGNLDRALLNFKHESLERPLLWKMHEAHMTLAEFKPLLANAEKRKLIEYFEQRFVDHVLPLDPKLRRSAIHNDANDNNILIQADSPWHQRINSIIDFGDMVYSWTIAEPAIAAAYAMLDQDHPLDAAIAIVKGYHRQNPLDENEAGILFDLIAMRLCMSVCICAHQKSLEPDNEYLSISEQPAWRLLEKLRNIPANFARYAFRHACGFVALPQHSLVTEWLKAHQADFHSVVNIDLKSNPLLWLDLGVASPYFSRPQESSDTAKMTRTLERAIEDAECLAGVGGYGEYRLLYDDDAFVDMGGHQRSMHLGIDIFMAAGTPVYAPVAGRVYSVATHAQDFDYGGCVILQHEIVKTGISFYSLYGHLSPGSIAFQAGDEIQAGAQIAVLGEAFENGRWPPHLHFQIILDMLGESDNFFGAGSHQYRDVWLSLCPDPNLVLGIPGKTRDHLAPSGQAILDSRKQTMNPSLSLSYREPIHALRGSMQYLYDQTGRRYLDAVNNVPHVGHCHPRVVEAGARQANLLSTNTRYLYASITDYCKRLLEKFPDPLSVCYLVNSGSEANDLALRLAKHYTARQDIVTVNHAYHGNLGSLIDISPYKHDGEGGSGRPANVHKARLPDSYRDPDTLENYITSVQACLKHNAAAFICESISGCGGQVVLPDGYLNAAYQQARESGALCIADEVQVGFGRVGTHFWGFETQKVIPDIVTLGKPIGNGHPLAAVITTREIADCFNNGMEYFNTFGGNPVSCATGLAVLDVIEDEQLQNNALMVGSFLLKGLKELQAKYSVIGDVRGSGLFIGVELVTSRGDKTPAAEQASYIAERMKHKGILISTDGPFHNVLKIKPPMCFSRKNAEDLVSSLNSILLEDSAQV